MPDISGGPCGQLHWGSTSQAYGVGFEGEGFLVELLSDPRQHETLEISYGSHPLPGWGVPTTPFTWIPEIYLLTTGPTKLPFDKSVMVHEWPGAGTVPPILASDIIYKSSEWMDATLTRVTNSYPISNPIANVLDMWRTDSLLPFQVVLQQPPEPFCV